MGGWILRSFITGVIATLVFYQLAIWVLSLVLPFPFRPWNLQPNNYGAPSVLALSFWAGVWVVPFAG